MGDLMKSFESRFVDTFPGDSNTRNSSRQVCGACFSFVIPTPVSNPNLAAYSNELAEQLGFDLDWMRTKQAASVLGGNELLPGMKPYAACYGGHQFGNFEILAERQDITLLRQLVDYTIANDFPHLDPLSPTTPPIVHFIDTLLANNRKSRTGIFYSLLEFK